MMTGGFSCQPFSALGDLRSAADPRSSCLSKLLFAAFYMRTQILILECVAPAAQDQFVKSEIDYFCQVTGFWCEQRNLKLDQVWPCKRNRAWWVLTSPVVGKVMIPEFQCFHAAHTIDRIIPFISPWDKDDEKALSLSGEELFAFGGHEQNFSQHLMNTRGKAPCALHAWGNQVTACPCGCRSAGLSAKRLEEKGIFGLLVHSAPDIDGHSSIRHVHPNEALALNGMDPTLDFGTHPRLVLSAVGQIASPLHVTWVMAAVLGKLEELKFGKSSFTPETQIQAYMSWLVARCHLVWPTPDASGVDDKFSSLRGCWTKFEQLSLEELMYPGRWETKLEAPVSIAAILDLLFRESQQQPVGVPVQVGNDAILLEPETPWLDFPTVSNDQGVCGLDVAFCTVFIDGDCMAPVKLSPTEGTTLMDLITAHEKLDGPLLQSKCTDADGNVLPADHVLRAGQVIYVWSEEKHHGNQNMHIEPCDPIQSTCMDVSPTVEWSQPIVQHDFQKPSIFDIGECSVEPVGDQPEWLCAEPLLGLKGEQFLQLSAPQIVTTQQLWSIRHQFLQVKDRLAILEHQGFLFADDEIRFLLFSLSQKFVDVQVRFSNDPVKQLVTIDPLITTAWMQNKGFSCEAWGKDHGFIFSKSLPVAAVFHVDGHWVPVFMSPAGDTLNVCVWDADSGNHMKLNDTIERIGLAVGFVSVIIQRDRRMFFSSDLCGTLASAYLHHTLLGVQLPTNQAETAQRAQLYREHFVHSIATCDITKRPWIWGNGDHLPSLIDEFSGDPMNFSLPEMLSKDRRIELIVEHGMAVADDEIRFHVQHIIDRYCTIMSQRGQTPVHKYVSFEPLIFTCWESIGRTISARWSERHPEIRSEGVQVLTAFNLDNHWFPIWCSPHDDCLTFHTIAHGTIDAYRLRDVCACIGQQLGFPLFALHVIPSRLPDHDLCGAQAMMFLAHVVHGASMPDEVQVLRDLHANMRATFVEDLLSKSEVPAPVLWGNGCGSGESGQLPIMPCVCPFVAHCDVNPGGHMMNANSQADTASLVSNTIDWQFVQNLFRWQAEAKTLCQPPEVGSCSAGQSECGLYTNAMDAAELVCHISRVQRAAHACDPSLKCPTIQVLPEVMISGRSFSRS